MYRMKSCTAEESLTIIHMHLSYTYSTRQGIFTESSWRASKACEILLSVMNENRDMQDLALVARALNSNSHKKLITRKYYAFD